MPGPITLVLPTADGWTGFRIPDHAVALELVRCFGHVLAVTSANRSGEPAARTAAEAMVALGASVDIVLDAGPCPGAAPSTVARVDGEVVTLLRPGPIPFEEMERTARGAE